MGGVRQMESIFRSLIVVCRSTHRNSLSRRRLTGFGSGSGVERRGVKGEENLHRYTCKCDTRTLNNDGLAFLDRTLHPQFFQPFFCCPRASMSWQLAVWVEPPHGEQERWDCLRIHRVHHMITESINTRLPKSRTSHVCSLPPSRRPFTPFSGAAQSNSSSTYEIGILHSAFFYDPAHGSLPRQAHARSPVGISWVH